MVYGVVTYGQAGPLEVSKPGRQSRLFTRVCRFITADHLITYQIKASFKLRHHLYTPVVCNHGHNCNSPLNLAYHLSVLLLLSSHLLHIRLFLHMDCFRISHFRYSRRKKCLDRSLRCRGDIGGYSGQHTSLYRSDHYGGDESCHHEQSGI